ncbi:autotransporter domain-containing protein [Candidatus Chlamydia sanziniae]|uniref:Autotransporter domain-containing protein n=1 Tax=Candidatus Chlamydia sanziniae TaxID=1806891 RepID=A0A1A9HXF0_9CHLA|nr:autotransporter domain-containing protein [Candidatus Chlamydia sanziniae]ANH78596.1 hypothetical protein Cs308_0425 [Candidatus Chlamydia sanziniae]
MAGGDYKAVKWVDGKIKELPDIPGGSKSSFASDVSADGFIIIGTYQKTALVNSAVKWEASKAIALGTLGGAGSTATAISADGKVIVGTSQTTVTADTTHAFVYKNNTMMDLGTLGGKHSTASAVSKDGSVIVGQAGLPSGEVHAFQYVDGKMMDLGTLGGENSTAKALSQDGKVIVGRSQIADGSWHLFLCYAIFPPHALEKPVILDLDNTYEALRQNGYQLNSLLNLQNMMLHTALNHEHTVFSKYRRGFSGETYLHALQNMASNLAGAHIQLTYEMPSSWRIGIFLNQTFSAHTPDNFHIKHSQPWTRACIEWRSSDSLGSSFRASFGYGNPGVTIVRKQLENTEAGSGNSTFRSFAGQIESRYGLPFGKGIRVQPFLGLKLIRISRENYAESNVRFPIYYDNVDYAASTGYVGTRAHIFLIPDFTMTARMGIEQNLYSHVDSLSGTIVSFGSFRFEELHIVHTRAFASLDFKYDLLKSQCLKCVFHVNQQPLQGVMGFPSSAEYNMGF